MNDTTTRLGAAEALRKVCVDAALVGYEDALLSGLCHEGAWEAAVSAIRRIDLDAFVDGTAETAPSRVSTTTGTGIEELTTLLARELASPGPPAAGSAAAATGAIAAGLLEWIARHSEEHGPESFRPRAGTIRGRAALFQSALAGAAQRDAEKVQCLIDIRKHENAGEVLIEAAESVLEIAGRCAQVATLAADLATNARGAFDHDVLTALQLACSASQCALDLFEANLPSDEDGSEWTRNAERRAWRVRLLLQRAAPHLAETRPG